MNEDKKLLVGYEVVAAINTSLMASTDCNICGMHTKFQEKQ